MNVNFILTNNIQKHLSLWMKCRMRSEDNTLVLSTCFQTCYCGELKQQWRRRQRERQKRNDGGGVGERRFPLLPSPSPFQFFLLPLQLSRYNSTGNACYAGYFGRASPFFSTFLCNRCTTATWNCLISLFGEREHKTTTFFFFSWTSIMKSI